MLRKNARLSVGALALTLAIAILAIFAGCSPAPTQPTAAPAGQPAAAPAGQPAAAQANPNASISSPEAKLGGDGSFAKAWTNGLRILTTNDAPYNFKDSSGKLVGIDAEIVAEATKRLKFPKVEYVEGPWESMVPSLQSNRGDLLQTNIHFTEQRAQVIDFTGPVYFYGDYLVVKKGNPLNLHKWEDLKGRSVGAIRGENYVDWLNKRGDLKEVKTYQTFNEEIADLAAGRTDAMIGDEVVYAYYLVQNPNAGIELVKDYVPQTDLADWTRFGVQKGASDLANAYTRVLDEMRVDGTTAKILAKYGIDKHALQVIRGQQ